LEVFQGLLKGKTDKNPKPENLKKRICPIKNLLSSKYLAEYWST